MSHEPAGPGLTSRPEHHQDRSPHPHTPPPLLHHQVNWRQKRPADGNLSFEFQLSQVSASIVHWAKFPGDLPLSLVDVSLDVIYSDFLSYSQVKNRTNLSHLNCCYNRLDTKSGLTFFIKYLVVNTKFHHWIPSFKLDEGFNRKVYKLSSINWEVHTDSELEWTVSFRIWFNGSHCSNRYHQLLDGMKWKNQSSSSWLKDFTSKKIKLFCEWNLVIWGASSD